MHFHHTKIKMTPSIWQISKQEREKVELAMPLPYNYWSILAPKMHAQFLSLSQLSFMDFPQSYYNYVHTTNVVAVNTNFPRWIDFGAEKSLHSSTYTLNSLEKWANPGQYQQGYTNWVIAGVHRYPGCGRSVDRLAAAAILPKNTLLKVCVQYQRHRFAAVSCQLSKESCRGR